MMAQEVYQHGALLPPELTLANRFGVSRATVRCAIMRLVDKGLLERKPGVGTRVRLMPGEPSLATWQSFSQEVRRHNIVAETYHQSVKRVPAPPHVASALQVAEDTALLQLDRVRGWDQVPVVHARTWFHPRLRIPETADFSKPLFPLIEELTGTVADSAREQMAAIIASAALAECLKTDLGEPLILRTHTIFDAGKRPMKFAELHYVSARYTLTMDLKRDSAAH